LHVTIVSVLGSEAKSFGFRKASLTQEESAMGALTIDLFSSLDGFAASDGWPGYWGKEGPERDQTLVMGANIYREMSQFVAEGDDPTFGTTQSSTTSRGRRTRAPFSRPSTEGDGDA
jgi:hypothetical protein